ncbi:MAG: hypothetical protein WKF85_07010 [Chitinophagaceae bacterium]
MASYTKKMHLANLKRDMDNAKSTGLKLNVSFIVSHCCAECDKLQELKIPIEELLKNPILPYRECIRKPFCICCYGFEPVSDENNRLVHAP